MLVFFVAGIHYDILKAFILSFEILPIGSYFLSASPMVEYAREVSNVFVIGTLIAAPFIALNFMINISFAVLGKAVPKMNVFMTSFSIRILSGLVLLVSSILLITSYILDGQLFRNHHVGYHSKRLRLKTMADVDKVQKRNRQLKRNF